MDRYERNFISLVNNHISSQHIVKTHLAKDIGISKARLSNYLSGRRSIPVDICVRIAIRFNLNLNYLFGLKSGGRHGKK